MGTEDDVMRLDGEGLSIRVIAERLGLSRMKVHRTLRAAIEPADELPADDQNDDDQDDGVALFDAEGDDYEAVGPFRFVGIVDGERHMRQDVRTLDANGVSASMLDVYRADQRDGEGRGFMPDVQRQIVEARYRQIVEGGYLRWTTDPPTEGERLA